MPNRRGPAQPPVDRTLTRVVVLMRLLGWAWLIVLTVVALSTSSPGPDTAVVVGTMVLATLGAGLTVLAARQGFLGSVWYAGLDGVIALTLAAAGLLTDFGEFLVGGYPASWIFIVAFATSLPWTAVAGVAASAAFAVLHVLMGLEPTRVFGSIQFVVVAVVVGWAFDALRERERLRLDAEEERAAAEADLAAEQRRSERLRERSALARRLHDSVLQTLNLISAAADEPAEVRYLARVQERDLRRTISEYESPFEDSFRARLLEARADVEDRYRVEIDQFIKDDAEMDGTLEAMIGAAGEAMNNAARHSESDRIDLFAEIREDTLQISVRDRGRGFVGTEEETGIGKSIVDRVEGVGGTVSIRSEPGHGTEVML
ncbi:MAG: ATP-binding protein, partial [Acidimicrobiia bacterium]